MCKQRFYANIEDQKDAVFQYLDRGFGKWCNDIYDDT